jgi:threonine dehydratase
MPEITIKDINEAQKRLSQIPIHSPLRLNKRLSQKYESNVFFKREDLQVVRSFKIRGAYNFISSLDILEKKKSVVCASAGNHAQGVAYSCQKLLIRGTIFMPSNTPKQKINKVKYFGKNWIEIKLVGKNFDETVGFSKIFQQKTGAIYVHPFDDVRTIAGQGTIGLEIWERMAEDNLEPDIVICAIGGGGLIAGTSLALKSKKENVEIIGVESESQASMFNSLKNKKISILEKIDTFADGTAVNRVGEITFGICQKNLSDLVLVEDGRICSDMIDLYQYDGIIAEPSGALAVSSLEKIKGKIKGKNVVCVICGGNNDIARYPEIIERSLIWKGLKHYFVVEFTQKPGELKFFLEKALSVNEDIVRFEYIKKTNKETGAALVGIELSKKEDLDALLDRFNKLEISYKKIQTTDLIYELLV